MSRVLRRLTGSGAGGAFVAGTAAPPADRILESNFITPTKDNHDLWLSGVIGSDKFAGGDMDLEIDASVAGTYDLRPQLPMRVDNRLNQISDFVDTNGATLVVQFRFFVWASAATITVTPAVYDITAAAAASISGQAACSASSEDFSGTNQQQSVALSLPNAVHYFKCQITIGGTPALGLTARGLALFDCYVALP